jgi:diguanylate cyclase (GGDEF)-like protein
MLAATTTAGLAVITERVATNQLKHQIGDRLAQRTKTLADKLDRAMFERYQDMTLHANILPDLGLLGHRDAIRAKLDALHASSDGYAWIGYAPRDGKILAATDGLLEGNDVSQRPWFEKASKAAYVGDVHRALLLEKKLNANGSEPLRFLDVAIPVFDRSRAFAGVLGAHLDWRWIQDIAHSMPYSGQSEFLLLSAQNTVLLGPKALQDSSLSIDSVQMAQKGRVGYQIEHWPDGKVYLIGYSQSQGYKDYPGLAWVILERQEIDRAFAPVKALRKQFIIWGAVIAGLFAFIGWFAAARISRPLLALTKAAESLQRGAPSSAMPHIKSYREVAVLAHTLRGMITELAQREAQLEHQATHHPLTQLPNRALVKAVLGQRISRVEDSHSQIAVLTVDLDRFKTVNDTLTYAAGDTVLQGAVKRLQDALGASGTLGHFGKDKFVMVLEDSAITLSQTMALAARAQQAFAKPFIVDGIEFTLPVSIGISLFPKDSKDAETLIGYSEIALYQAKTQGGNRMQFYEAQMNAAALERLELERHLRYALEQRQLELHYQPQVSLRTGAIIGAEALIRWRHPERGLVSPAKFIPVAEASGLIIPIGDWVLAQACAQAQAWRNAGLQPLRISVNVSAHQFNEGKLVQKVSAALKQTGLGPEWLKLEITESLLMQEVEHSIAIMKDLTGLGVHLAIDDFGTGYSSLSYLKQFPISELKIDQAFVRELSEQSEDAAIVRTIIALCQNLRLSVIAEGVETEEQACFLRQTGCDEMQGYYFSRPLPADEMANLLRSHRAVANEAQPEIT